MLRQLSETPEGECAGHYVERIEGLYAHARETCSTHVLVDVIAWWLARLAHQNGPAAAGTILRGIGSHLASIADAEAARLEAGQAKASGRRPH